MTDLATFFAKHPLEAPYRPQKRATCIRSFRHWLDDETFNEWHLSLFPLSGTGPLAHHSDEALNQALAFFLRDPAATWQAIAKVGSHITHATSSLLRPGPSWSSDDVMSLDSPDQAAQFESTWHPEYQRFAEHVFNHLTYLPLEVLGSINSRDYTSQTLANRVASLAAEGLPSLTTGFDSTVRNAIAHGTTEFELAAIRYQDRRKSLALMPFEFETLFDSLVDTSLAILASIIIFAARTRDLVTALPSERLPFGFRYLLTLGLASYPGINIQSILETRTPGTGAQLNIVFRTTNPSRASQQYDALFLAWVSACLSSTYDRYFISIDSGKPSHSVLAIDGKELAEIVRGRPLEQASTPLIQASLLWHDAPKWRSWIATITTIWRARWPALVEELRATFENSGLVKPVYRYVIVEIQNTSTSSIARATAYIYLIDASTPTATHLIATVKHVLRVIRRTRLRRMGTDGPRGIPSQPAHVTMRLHTRPLRLRTMKHSSWASNDLLLIAEWAGSRRSGGPFLTREAHYSERRLTIKYSPTYTTALGGTSIKL